MKSKPGSPPSDGSTKRRILVVDDHPVTRLGILTLIGRQTDIVACGEASGPQQALELVQRHQPDLAIVDLAHGTLGGIELVRNIRAVAPKMRVLVMSMLEEQIYAERSLRAGASGYILKRQSLDEILAAIRLVLSGELYLSEHVKARLLQRLAKCAGGEVANPIETLTDREMEVFTLIGNGFRSNQIATTLHLSTKTIDSHREHLKKKLALGSGDDLVRHAIQWTKSREAD
jgi:DNA-binding NarL/FixJ family response regulator